MTAAAVVLQPDFAEQLVQEGHLNDSKKLTKAKREALRIEIEAHALAWAVTMFLEEIDRINILNASFTPIRRSVQALSVQADYMLIDGDDSEQRRSSEYGCYVKGMRGLLHCSERFGQSHGMLTCWVRGLPVVRLGCQCGLSHETTPLAIREHGITPTTVLVPSAAGADDLVWLNNSGTVTVTNATA